MKKTNELDEKDREESNHDVNKNVKKTQENTVEKSTVKEDNENSKKSVVICILKPCFAIQKLCYLFLGFKPSKRGRKGRIG